MGGFAARRCSDQTARRHVPTCAGVCPAQDPQDAGPGYRNVVGLPGGIHSPLYEVLKVKSLALAANVAAPPPCRTSERPDASLERPHDRADAPDSFEECSLTWDLCKCVSRSLSVREYSAMDVARTIVVVSRTCDVQARNVNGMELREGDGNGGQDGNREGDKMNVVWIVDSDKLPFYRAEVTLLPTLGP